MAVKTAIERKKNNSRMPQSNQRQGKKSNIADLINELSIINRMPFENLLTLITKTILDSAGKDCVKKIYLFGSHAYGTPTEESDIDLCVIFLDTVDEDEVYLRIAHALFAKKIIPVDLLIYKENYFNHEKEEKCVINTIYNYGKLLYG